MDLFMQQGSPCQRYCWRMYSQRLFALYCRDFDQTSRAGYNCFWPRQRYLLLILLANVLHSSKQKCYRRSELNLSLSWSCNTAVREFVTLSPTVSAVVQKLTHLAESPTDKHSGYHSFAFQKTSTVLMRCQWTQRLMPPTTRIGIPDSDIIR